MGAVVIANQNPAVTELKHLSLLGRMRESAHSAQLQFNDLCPMSFKVNTLIVIGRLLQLAAAASLAAVVVLSFTITPTVLLGLVPTLLSGIAGSLLVSSAPAIAWELTQLLYIPRAFVPGQPVGIENADGLSCWLAAALQMMANSASIHTRLRALPDVMVGPLNAQQRLRDLYPASPLNQFLDCYQMTRDSAQRVASNIDVLGIRNYLSVLTNGEIAPGDTQEDAAAALEAVFGPMALHPLRQAYNGGAPRDRPEATIQVAMSPPAATHRPNFHEMFLNYFNYIDDQGGRFRLQFQTAPNAMVVQLKRFLQADVAGRFQGVKNSDLVDIPSQLDLSPDLIEDGSQGSYKCDMFVVHLGTVNSGHYYTMVKAAGLWWMCDGSRVQEVTERQALAELPSAYLVHYTKI